MIILKNFILIFLIILIYIFIGSIFSSKQIIPEEAIRFRVVANSDSERDQEIKKEISNEIGIKLYDLLKDTKGIDEARKVILNNMNKFKDVLELYNIEYDITYGSNYFPDKVYKGIIYEEGFYESLLITLGTGAGKNWWCVLFPPLCLLEAEESEEYEYKSFVKEIVEKYM